MSAYVSPNAVIFVTGPYYHESMALAIGVEDDVLCDKKPSKHHYCQDITNLLNLGIPTFWSYHPAYLQRINALHATAAAIASIKC